MNGCHNTIPNSRLQNELVYHSKGNVSWPYVFSRDCQYIKQANVNDAGCDGCKEKIKQDQKVTVITLTDSTEYEPFNFGTVKFYLKG